MAWCTRYSIMSVTCHKSWFSPVSSINKTDRHDITEILLKVALNTITLTYCMHTHFRVWVIMKRKLKRWWSAIPSISTKRTIAFHLMFIIEEPTVVVKCIYNSTESAVLLINLCKIEEILMFFWNINILSC